MMRWMKRLARRDARVRLHPAHGYGVYPHGDLRRRALADVRTSDLVQARSEGWIRGNDRSGYELTHEGRQALARQGMRSAVSMTEKLIVSKPFIKADEAIEYRPVDMSHSPLSRWMRPDKKTGKPFLTETEFEAGEALRADYHRSTLNPRVTSDWSRLAAPSAPRGMRRPEDAPVSALQAKERVFKALAYVGPGLDRLLMRVCLNENAMERIEEEEAWARRSGKTVLKIALQRLAVFYGFMPAQAPLQGECV